MPSATNLIVGHLRSTKKRFVASRRLHLMALVAMAIAMAGCGGSTANSSSASTQQSQAGQVLYSYIGTSPEDISSATGPLYGVWSVSILCSAGKNSSDSCASGNFSAWNTRFTTNNNDWSSPNSTPKVAGAFTEQNGFLSLTQNNYPSSGTTAQPAGFALQIPGRAVLVRQGGPWTELIALVPNGCPSTNGTENYAFVTLPTCTEDPYNCTWDFDSAPVYGTFSITANDSAWNFTNYQELTLSATPTQNNGMAWPAGVCAPTIAGQTISVPASSSSPFVRTVGIGPSKILVVDQGDTEATNLNPGLVGVLQPSAPLNTADVLSKSYSGFIYEAGAGTSSFLLDETDLAEFNSSQGLLAGGAILSSRRGSLPPIHRRQIHVWRSTLVASHEHAGT